MAAATNCSMPLLLPPLGLKTNKGHWLPQVGVPAGCTPSLPYPFLPGLLYSYPRCWPAPRPAPLSGLLVSEQAQWPHLLDLLGVQFGDIENLLCLLEAEAGEVRGGCRLVSGTSPGISCCPAGCMNMGLVLNPQQPRAHLASHVGGSPLPSDTWRQK